MKLHTLSVSDALAAMQSKKDGLSESEAKKRLSVCDLRQSIGNLLHTGKLSARDSRLFVVKSLQVSVRRS